MDKFEQTLAEIENDKVSGSAALADKFIALLLKQDLSANEKIVVRKRIEEISRQKPFFATLTHLSETLKSNERNWPEALTAYMKRYDKAADSIAKQLASVLQFETSILLHSRSKTILTVFEQLLPTHKYLKIYQTQSHPEKEGIIQATELYELGFSVELVQDIPPQSIFNEVGAFISGADLILPDRFINKVGTKRIAEKMNQLGKAFYVLADSRKFSSREMDNLPDSFEVIPRSIVTNLITELAS